jgi:hypothetical protein
MRETQEASFFSVKLPSSSVVECLSPYQLIKIDFKTVDLL